MRSGAGRTCQPSCAALHEPLPLQAEAAARDGYARRVGLFSGVMLVIGGIIGSGMLLNPAIVAQRVHTPVLTLAVWLLGGAMALIGAFIHGELGQRIPKAGGSHVSLWEERGEPNPWRVWETPWKPRSARCNTAGPKSSAITGTS